MLGGERTVGLTTDLTPKPSSWDTFSASIEKPTLQVDLLTDYIWPGVSSEEQRRSSADRLSNINEMIGDPRIGIGQTSFNMVGDVIGSLLPTTPLAIAGGAIGSGVASAVGFGARKLALAASLEGAEGGLLAYAASQVPLNKLATSPLKHFLPSASAAEIAAGGVEAYGAYKGFTIPEHFVEHYDAVNNTLDTQHAIEDWGSDNYGFLFGAAPLAAGYVLFKGVRGVIAQRAAKASNAAVDAELSRLLKEHEEVLAKNKIVEGQISAKEAQVSQLQEHLQEAENMGEITPEQHEWYLDYLENPNNPALHERGLGVLKSLQIPYDRFSGRVWHEVLSSRSVKNLNSALFDQAITNFDENERQLLTSYLVHNELDAYVSNMRENPDLLMAIKGLTHTLTKRIESHSVSLRDMEHKLLETLPKGILKKHVFSQANLYNHLRNIFPSKSLENIGYKTARDIPYHLPRNVVRKLQLLRRIDLIKSRKNARYEAKFQAGQHKILEKRLKEIKLLTPAEELQDIIDKLMPVGDAGAFYDRRKFEGKLIKDFKTRAAYSRLEDLSQVWPEAKVLLDRIHGEAINEKQKGLNEILKKFTEMVDVTASRLADPSGVKRYLHSRIERSIPFVREFEQSGIDVAASEIKVAEKAELKPEVMFDESSKEKVNSTKLSDAKKEYESIEKKYHQMSSNQKALAELITCAMGV